MKTCPVCSAKAFDDARICYGCMHSFEAESQRKKEPSPLDNTTLDWLAPENLRPLTDTSEGGWISGNDIPPWIETYKGDLDLAEVAVVQRADGEKDLPKASETKKESLSSSSSCDDGYYEVPLEVYAESWFGDTYELQPSSSSMASWENVCYSEAEAPASHVNVLANCAVSAPENRVSQTSAQEVVVRLEFGWADSMPKVPIRVESRQDWLSKTPVAALSAAG